MSQAAFNSSRFILVSLLGCGLVFLALIIANMGLSPVVMGDEYTYTKFALLKPFAEATLPNYLYFFIFSSTNYCGAAFIECARVFNVFLFIAATPFIYLIGITITTRRVAAVVCLLALLSPFNRYTAYFMPEASYYFCFWLFAWQILTTKVEDSYLAWSLVGISLGLLSLIKPHAIFIIPAAITYIFFLFSTSIDAGRGKAMRVISSVLFSVALIKFGLAYWLAGKAGVTLFGDFYNDHSAVESIGSDQLVELFSLALRNLGGHLLTLCLLFGVVICQLVFTLFNRRPFSQGGPAENQLHIFTFLCLICLIAMTVAFTARLGLGSGEFEALRLHLRYYNFTFPLFLLVVATILPPAAKDQGIKQRLLIGTAVAAAVIYAFATNLEPFKIGHVDGPELLGFVHLRFHRFDSLYYAMAACGVISVIVWAFRPRISGLFFLLFFYPLVAVTNGLYLQGILHDRNGDPQQRSTIVGQFINRYFSDIDLKQLVVISADALELYRIQVHYDNTLATTLHIKQDQPVEISSIPNDRTWAVILGNNQINNNGLYKAQFSGFSVVRIRRIEDEKLDFRDSSHPRTLQSIHPVRSAESWGTWSTDRHVRLEFIDALPQPLSIELVAHTLGPNIDKAILVKVGDQSEEITLGSSPTKQTLNFCTHNEARSVEFEAPHTFRLSDLGDNQDSRTLGIAFTSLRISKSSQSESFDCG